jgi:hypothetical protein
VTARLCAVLTLASLVTACSHATAPQGETAKSFDDVSLLEQTCMTKLKDYLIVSDAKRMDAFFSKALNGLVTCEASSGLAHVPTREVSRWLATADGRPVAGTIPKPPAELASLPAADERRVPYQRACVSYMRRYIPASVAHAGDDPDVAAAFTFNALEECDSDSGFATITPSDLAAIMQAKHLL